MTIPGLMQQTPLTITELFKRMRDIYYDGEVVSYSGSDGTNTRATYGEVADRAQRLAAALLQLGVKPGDRVASFGFNHQRHLELYWAVPLIGCVLHTINIRLYGEQITYITNHAEDKVVFYDGSLADSLSELTSELNTVKHYVRMGDGDLLPGAIDYEELVGSNAPLDPLPQVDENAACGICYTSGTTGMPKGVLSSHRAMYLHSMGMCMPAAIGLDEPDRVLPIVPMFHAFGWGLPYSAPFTGAELVFHGEDTGPENLARILENEKVTVTAGVPTIWKSLLPLAESGELNLEHLRLIFVGGSASPKKLIEAYTNLGVEYLQVWGMTETGPLACASRPRRNHRGLSANEILDVKEKTGTVLPGVEGRIVGDDDKVLPRDGRSVGQLEVRGPWIASAYYNDPSSDEKFHDEWLRTGDVAYMEPNGYFRIVDRAKDLVKSGGEWISSVELEGAMLAHPSIADAAVIGCASAKWDERPVAAVVLKPGAQEPSLEEMREFLAPNFAKWWLPDHLEVVDEIPKTSVGKIDKKVLRTQLEHVRLP